MGRQVGFLDLFKAVAACALVLTGRVEIFGVDELAKIHAMSTRLELGVLPRFPEDLSFLGARNFVRQPFFEFFKVDFAVPVFVQFSVLLSESLNLCCGLRLFLPLQLFCRRLVF